MNSKPRLLMANPCVRLWIILLQCKKCPLISHVWITGCLKVRRVSWKINCFLWNNKIYTGPLIRPVFYHKVCTSFFLSFDLKTLTFDYKSWSWNLLFSLYQYTMIWFPYSHQNIPKRVIQINRQTFVSSLAELWYS